MNKAAFVISLTSLVLATTAYWRAGGKQDIQALGRVAQAIAASYDKSRQRLQIARNHLRQLKEEAVEGLEKQVQLAQDQLETLARRLEEGAKSAKDATATAARNVEQAIALRVRRIEARTMLLRPKPRPLALSAWLRKRISSGPTGFWRTRPNYWGALARRWATTMPTTSTSMR